MYFIHCFQMHRMSPRAPGNDEPGFKRLWYVPLKFQGIVRGWFQSKHLSESDSDEIEFIVSSVLSICLFCFNFSFRVGLIPALRMIAVLLVLAPLGVSLGFVPGSRHARWFLIGYAAILLVAWCSWSGFRSFCKSSLAILRAYCCFGRSGTEDREKGALRICMHMLLAGSLLILAVFTIWPNNHRARWASLLFILIEASLALYVLKVVMASHRDVQKLATSIYYLCCEVSYPVIMYELGRCFLKSGKMFCETSVLHLYALLFCVILPLVHKFSATMHVRRLARSLSDNDFYQVIDNSDECYSFMFSCVKRQCYWWPLAESVWRIVYCVLCLKEVDNLNKKAGWLFGSVVLLLRPYRNFSALSCLVSEAVVMLVWHQIAVKWPDWWNSTDGAYIFGLWQSSLWVFILPFFSYLIGQHSADIHVFKTEFISLDTKLSESSKEREMLTVLRLSVGLPPSVMPKTVNDQAMVVPILSSETIGHHSTPCRDVASDIEGVLDGLKEITAADIANFHVSIGKDPYVFKREIEDSDLPNSVLIERVEYDIGVRTRIFSVYQFPVAFLFFSACASRWIKQSLASLSAKAECATYKMMYIWSVVLVVLGFSTIVCKIQKFNFTQ